MIIVKNKRAIIVPTASANRLTSWAHGIGMVPPATAISNVATPGMNQAGTACATSIFPCSNRLAIAKQSASVEIVPTVHMTSASVWLSWATTDESSRIAIVIVPKKLPATGCRYSPTTASGCLTALTRYPALSTTNTIKARIPAASAISGLTPNCWLAWRHAIESPAIPITDANRLTGRFLMEAVFRKDCGWGLESVDIAHSPDFWGPEAWRPKAASREASNRSPPALVGGGRRYYPLPPMKIIRYYWESSSQKMRTWLIVSNQCRSWWLWSKQAVFLLRRANSRFRLQR